MVEKNFGDDIINEVKSMSSEEFLAFAEEYENMPDVPFFAGICNFSPVTSEPEFFISVASVCVDSPSDIEYDGDDWAWVA